MNPRRTMLVVLLCIGLGVLSAHAQNLVTNGDFSNGTNGWGFSGVHIGESQEGFAGISTPGFPGGYAQITLDNYQASLTQPLSTSAGAYCRLTFSYYSIREGGEAPYVPFSGAVSFGGWSTNFNYTNYVLTSSVAFPAGLYVSSPQQFTYVMQVSDTNQPLIFSIAIDSSIPGFAYFGNINVTQTGPFFQQPQSTNVIDGGTATFTVVPVGSPPYAYQWWGGASLASAAILASQTNSTLTIPVATSTNGGTYFVVVTNTAFTGTSSVAVLNLYVPALKVTTTTGGQFALSFAGSTNFPYILQSASSLTSPATWQPVTTNYTDSNGNWTATVTNSQAASYFFQAVGP